MNGIFISYSSYDRPWALALEDRLRQAGLTAFMDKISLIVGGSFQDDLFRELKGSVLLVILWSTHVRDEKGNRKEWIITEREQFRAFHPDGPIIYLLLDDEQPDVDAHMHKIDLLQGIKGPAEVQGSIWNQIEKQIKKIVCPDIVRIKCYTLAVTRPEFEELSREPNLKKILANLDLNFTQVANWYGDRRSDWRPAGGPTIEETLSNLENPLAQVFREDGVPERFQGCEQLVTLIETKGLWELDDAKVKEEIDCLAGLDLYWIIIDPLSLYHPRVQQVATRIGACAECNHWMNIFLIDPVGRILDRSSLRTKLENDFAYIYRRLVKPKLRGNLFCLGGVDLWHPDDFERVFRETIRLQHRGKARQDNERVPERAFTTLAHKR
ncbi:MAG: toll/interleukin-1 receptor domain-containing protein [Nitrospira sp.]|nr:toll/interleukin-1 receptor domain-containing protein [Nitrospira sp.]